jgi:hypothetical protein
MTVLAQLLIAPALAATAVIYGTEVFVVRPRRALREATMPSCW